MNCTCCHHSFVRAHVCECVCECACVCVCMLHACPRLVVASYVLILVPNLFPVASPRHVLVLVPVLFRVASPCRVLIVVPIFVSGCLPSSSSVRKGEPKHWTASVTSMSGMSTDTQIHTFTHTLALPSLSLSRARACARTHTHMCTHMHASSRLALHISGTELCLSA